MISVTEAKALIGENTALLQAAVLDLSLANGLVLAETVIAPHDIPAYPQSSMDGYAFTYAEALMPLRIVGEQAAGDTLIQQLEPGTAVRIFTGAAVPPGADTVLPQEKAEVKERKLSFDQNFVKRGDHVRPAGSEIRKGEVALTSLRLLTPPAIGFLAAIGISWVKVYPSPRIAIIVTGNELLKPGTEMEYGKVFEASSYALEAALHSLGISNIDISFVRDDLEIMTSRLEDALKRSDLVVMTGGVSVGDHDHTAAAAEICSIKKVFHKVKQKPGKPLFFGTKGRQCFFGLPGNPSSVLTCFYEYVLPCIAKLTGREIGMKTSTAVLARDFKKPKGLTHFLKGIEANGVVEISGGQESYKLSSFALANCLVVLSEEHENAEAGDEVAIHLLP